MNIPDHDDNNGISRFFNQLISLVETQIEEDADIKEFHLCKVASLNEGERANLIIPKLNKMLENDFFASFEFRVCERRENDVWIDAVPEEDSFFFEKKMHKKVNKKFVEGYLHSLVNAAFGQSTTDTECELIDEGDKFFLKADVLIEYFGEGGDEFRGEKMHEFFHDYEDLNRLSDCIQLMDEIEIQLPKFYLSNFEFHIKVIGDQTWAGFLIDKKEYNSRNFYIQDILSYVNYTSFWEWCDSFKPVVKNALQNPNEFFMIDFIEKDMMIMDICHIVPIHTMLDDNFEEYSYVDTSVLSNFMNPLNIKDITDFVVFTQKDDVSFNTNEAFDKLIEIISLIVSYLNYNYGVYHPSSNHEFRYWTETNGIWVKLVWINYPKKPNISHIKNILE